MEFFDWKMLATSAGCAAMVSLLTQFTKDLGFIKKIPTQVWSFILALVVLYPAYAFTGALNVSTAFLVPFNAVVVALASNGIYDGISRIVSGAKVDNGLVMTQSIEIENEDDEDDDNAADA